MFSFLVLFCYSRITVERNRCPYKEVLGRPSPEWYLQTIYCCQMTGEFFLGFSVPKLLYFISFLHLHLLNKCALMSSELLVCLLLEYIAVYVCIIHWWKDVLLIVLTPFAVKLWINKRRPAYVAVQRSSLSIQCGLEWDLQSSTKVHQHKIKKSLDISWCSTSSFIFSIPQLA